ncbi:MAG: hypothetical protein ABUS47_01740 [Steroidobacter sp.]
MTPLFKKLNLGDHRVIHVIKAPDAFESEIAALSDITIKRTLAGSVQFAIAFATTRKEVDAISAQLIKAGKGDAVIWMAYPKGSSKRYQCDFNRDSGWQVLRDAGFDTVRMVALDEDWSALRFRRVENIGVAKKGSKPHSI